MRTLQLFLVSSLRSIALMSVGLLAVSCRSTTAASADTHTGNTQKIHVDTVVVSEQSVAMTLPLTGTLAPSQRTDLSANAVGRVVRTYVERGDHVEKNQLLVQLDARSLSLAAKQARANLDGAVARFREKPPGLGDVACLLFESAEAAARSHHVTVARLRI